MSCILIAVCLAPGHSHAQDKDKEMPEPEEEKETAYVAVEDMPELKGGLAKLQKKVNYPDAARKAGIEGRVIIHFIINKKGKVENPRVIRGIGGGCDEEAIRVIKKAEFTPGKHNGQIVRVQKRLPIKFGLTMSEKSKEDMPEPPKENKEEKDPVIKTIHPELIGSKDSLFKQIKYPTEAKKKGIEGYSVVGFIVDKNGNVTEPRIMKPLCPSCDQEVLKVIKETKFKPSKKNGKRVRVWGHFRVPFKLDDSK